MILQGYHGTQTAFKMFDYAKTATNGAEHGAGFYITDCKQVAQMYGTKLLKIDFNINTSFSNDKITITQTQLKNFIKNYIDPTGAQMLNDFNDVLYYGYDTVLNEVVNSYFNYNNNDVDIISEVIAYNASRLNNPAKMFDNIYKVFKKDNFHYTQTADNGDKINNYIIFSNKQIKNIMEA